MTGLFPTSTFASCENFASTYFEHLANATKTSDLSSLDQIASKLAETFERGGIVFICGNGGSAGIANHSLCDFLKGTRTDTELKPRFFSLSSHTEMLSALSNDIGYEDVFAYQLRSMARPDDLLWTVSSSGDSENVVQAILASKEIGMSSISFTGFSGGRSRELADLNAHVDAHNYGVVEDIHMAYVHILTQYLRMTHMDPGLIAERKF